MNSGVKTNGQSIASSSYPHSEHIDTIIRLFKELGNLAENATAQDLWGLIEIARGLEHVSTLRGIFDTALIQMLRTPAGIKEVGTANTTRFLVDNLGISHREALKRINASALDSNLEPKDSHAVDEKKSPRQQELERQRAAELAQERQKNRATARQATEAGTLTVEARAAITSALRRLKPGGSMSAEEIKAEVLAEHAGLSIKQIGDLARQLVDKSNAVANTKPNPFADLQKRGLYFDKPDKDGCIKFGGTMDAATSALFLKQIHANNKPNNRDGKKDRRTYSQLNADAFAHILKNAAAWSEGNTHHGHPGLASIVAVAKPSDFPYNPNYAQQIFSTNVGIDLNAAQLLRLGVTDDFLLALMDDNTGLAPVNLSMLRGQRLASFEQRAALQIIDGCCQFPGCDMPIDRCDVHHVIAFIAEGRTDLENLVSMCRSHHCQNDDSRRRRNRFHMCDRTEETHFRSGAVWVDSHGNKSEPRFNTGPTAKSAPGYVAPPGRAAQPGHTAPPGAAPPNRKSASDHSAPSRRKPGNTAPPGRSGPHHRSAKSQTPSQ